MHPPSRRRTIGFAILAAGAAGGGLLRATGSDATGAGPVVEWRQVPAVRGEILDRNGTPLAENRGAFDVYVRPQLFGPEVRDQLVELLDLDEAEVAEMDRRASASRAEPAREVLLLADQGRRRAGRIDNARRALGGAVELHLEAARHYPHGELAAHVVGYASPASERELALLGLEPDAVEPVGRHGLEESLEKWLHGYPGIARFAVDAGGERLPAADVEELSGRPAFEPPVAGHDVVLTLDLEIQRVADRAVRDQTAAAVVVAEVETGRILALVSRPSFDPDAMTGPGARAELRLELDPTRPLVDRTVAPYAPGSTYKLATAIAGLESGGARRDEEHTCSGSRQVGKRTLLDMGVHGTVDFLQALQVSCNVYFWMVAERVGIDRIASTARDLGFGAATGLGINGDSAGLVPDRTTYDLEGPRGLEHTLITAIGNGEVRVTAVQLAMAYAAVGNGGRLYAPQLVRRIQTASGEVMDERHPILRRRIDVSTATLATIREGMWRAVNVAGGTGYAARKGAVEMIGKTGTALPPPHDDLEKDPTDPRDLDASHAWFVGLAPAAKPELVVVVLVEHGGVGGKVAAPIALAIVDGSFAVLRRQQQISSARSRASRRH